MKLKEKLIDTFLGGVIESKVKERLRATSVIDSDETEWRRLTGKEIRRDLTPLKQDRMIEICFYLWENTPLGKWLIEIIKDFILAEGLPYEAKHEDVKAILDDFWYDPLNRMDLYIDKHVRELFIYGELCFPAFVAQQTGKVRLGYIDPSQISVVMTDPENVKIVIGVILKGTSGEEGRKYATILPEGADEILSQPAQTLRKSYMDGQCFFFAINNLTNSPRGRSELLAVADWIDAYENFMFDFADKWRLINAFIWDLEVSGGDEKAIKDQINNLTKKAGSVFGHNEKVKLTAQAPSLNAVDVGEGSRLFRNHILGAQSFPEHWYGGGGDVNRATSVEMGTPTFKSLDAKQRYFKFILESIFGFCIEQARAANYLRVTDDEAGDYSVITPDIVSKDLTKYSAAIQQIASSLAIAELNGWVDRATSIKVFAAMIAYLGIEIDAAEMEQAIEEQKIRDANQDYLKDREQPGGKSAVTSQRVRSIK